MGIFIIIVAAWVSLGIAGFYYVQYQKEKQEVEKNLSMYFNTTVLKKDHVDRWTWITNWLDRLAPIGEKIELLSDVNELESHLIKAGNPYGLTLARLQGAKIAGFLIGLSLGFVVYVIGIPLISSLLAVICPLGGYMAPLVGIRMLAKKRQGQIQQDLPDFLDMMSITLQAGMGLDEALTYYVQTSKGPLSEEFTRLLQEVKFGVQREVAYRSLLNRTEVPELEALIQSLIQAHNLGTPLSDTFTQQAYEMRRMRAEKAKEMAGKASPKISMISGLIIAPSIMILIFGTLILKYFFSPDSPFKMFF